MLLVLLGIWGGLIPFVGPYFDYSFGSNSTWHYTTDRLWLNILPGAAALLAGLLLFTARTRGTAALGSWLAMLAGVWFVIGPAVSLTWESGGGPIGPPLYGSTRQMLELIGYFYLLGALILALGAFVLGRLTPARPLTRPSSTIGGSPALTRTPGSATGDGPFTAAAPPRPTGARQPTREGRVRMPLLRRHRTPRS